MQRKTLNFDIQEVSEFKKPQGLVRNNFLIFFGTYHLLNALSFVKTIFDNRQILIPIY